MKIFRLVSLTLTIFISFNARLYASWDDFNCDLEFKLEEAPLFVSLGGYCYPALKLREYGLRNLAYPFDWIFSIDTDGIIKILDDDFRFFLDYSFIKLGDGDRMFHSLYNTVFLHDGYQSEFKNNLNRFSEFFEEFKTKYNRRIERFRNIRQYPGKVFFFRIFWTEKYQGERGEFNENTKNARNLKNALDRYFPSLDYVLIIISSEGLNIPKMEAIDGVIEYTINREGDEFKSMINTIIYNY